MSADAIARVTVAFQERLRAALVAASDKGSVFVGPFDDAQARAASLSLFPYRIVPNPGLRNTAHRVPASSPASPPIIVYRDALPLDVYYLVSVGARPGLSEETLLRVLGFAIQMLQADPDLPAATITPTGTMVSLVPETVRVTFDPLSTDEISRIWALWPTANYRTSVAYLVSPVWVYPPQPPQSAAPVLTDTLGAGVAAPTQATGDVP